MANIYLNKDSTHSYMIETTSASVVPFSVKAAGSQTANIIDIQNSSGTVLTSISSGGDIVWGNRTGYIGGATWGLTFSYSTGSLQGYFNFGKYLFADTMKVSQSINWGSDVFNIAPDVGIDRSAAGILKLTNASSGNGSLILGAYSASTVALTVKAASAQSANIQEWQNSSGTVIAKITSSGEIAAVSDGLRAGTLVLTSTEIRRDGYSRLNIRNPDIQSGGASDISLVVKGSSAQTANLQEWQNSSGTVLTKIGSAGRIDIMNAAGSSAIGSFYNNSDISTFHTDTYNIATDGSTNVVSTEIYMSPSFALNWSATTLGSRDVGLKRDTTNRLKLTNGSTGYGQLKLAYPVINQNSAPADGDLAANECSIWFDSTNGASKLKIKGKSADGTVVSGEVTLT